MYQKLFALKIPSAWAVIHHSFGNEDPVVINGSIVNDEFYNEDLLSIEPIRFNGTNWETDPEGYVFDLGWYPEADPDGSYKLSVIKGSWEHIIVQVESKNRKLICDLIEQCFDLITKGVQAEKIAEFIENQLLNNP